MATLEEIKKLRDMTGAGINAVREALEASKGDSEAAMKYLREKGIAKADKRKDKTASDGTLGVYVHNNNKVIVVVEVACETDFAAKSPDMVQFAKDVALHIAATTPKFINVEAIPAEELAKEKETYMKELEGKPENIKENILKGKLEKFYKDSVLLEQTAFTNEEKTIGNMLTDLTSKIGEKIQIKQFAKFEVSQEAQIATINN